MESLFGLLIVAESLVTPGNVFKKSVLVLGLNHRVQHLGHSEETLGCCAHIFQSFFIIKNLLDNESGNSLGQLSSSVHDPETQRNDLSVKQEVDHVRVIPLN